MPEFWLICNGAWHRLCDVHEIYAYAHKDTNEELRLNWVVVIFVGLLLHNYCILTALMSTY